MGLGVGFGPHKSCPSEPGASPLRHTSHALSTHLACTIDTPRMHYRHTRHRPPRHALWPSACAMALGMCFTHGWCLPHLLLHAWHPVPHSQQPKSLATQEPYQNTTNPPRHTHTRYPGKHGCIPALPLPCKCSCPYPASAPAPHCAHLNSTESPHPVRAAPTGCGDNLPGMRR